MHRLFLVIAVLAALPLPALAKDSPYSGNAKVRTVLDTWNNLAEQTIAWPHKYEAKATILEIDIPPGGETGWHRHPVPLFGYVISGTLTVYLADGTKKSFGPGEGFAEAVNLVHDGHNDGTEPLKFIVFIAGERGVDYTQKVDAPQ